MSRFDRYVAVDWSASASPKTGADSVWIADIVRGDGAVSLQNPATRRQAEAALEQILADAVDQRTLIGVDASLGYPAGSSALFGLDGAPWSAMWSAINERITDDVRNANNRFEVASNLNALAGSGPGPFWGTPPARATEHLTTTKVAPVGVKEFRACEEALRATGRTPASCWQLLGVGSVGSQTLTLIPVLQRLRRRHARIDVWPFTTGLRSPDVEPGGVVIAEIWPTAFDPEVPIGMIRDAAQVSAVVRQHSEADASDDLDRWFAPDVAPDLLAQIEREEGWVLGP